MLQAWHVANIFTKPVPIVLFENMNEMIGMKDEKYLSLRKEFGKH